MPTLELSRDPETADRQLRAIVFYLVASGSIDNDFSEVERRHSRVLIEQLVRQLVDLREPDAAERAARLLERYLALMARHEREIWTYLAEPVAAGETQQQFVTARLKARCMELLQRFDEEGQRALLAVVEQLIWSDGVLHPGEEALRDELLELLSEPEPLDEGDLEPWATGEVLIAPLSALPARAADHAFFEEMEWDYPRDREGFARQSVEDMGLLARAMEIFEGQRALGAGSLDAASSFADFAGREPFLDGHVQVLPPEPGRAYELLVVGDLHGCYSCFKAALLQADFLDKVRAHEADPDGTAAPHLVLLGDYIDRGRFSFSGTLRAALRLLVSFPEHVVMLRGNHEHYLEEEGQIISPIQPCEALESVADLAPPELLRGYKRLFDTLPSVFVFNDLLFVHAGIPKDETLGARWKGLSSLNDRTVRLEMVWSDPSAVRVVPAKLQRQTIRFSYGLQQFQGFMRHLGCRMMIRGHELVDEGFRQVYDDPDTGLVTLFSAGGAHNEDLPPGCSYRDARPAALIIRHQDGVTEVRPFELDYRRYNDPRLNRFYRVRPR
jgi:hypothetical protein